MKPVDQTIFGAKKGNCMSACVATLLELSIDEVPNFMENSEEWAKLLHEFLYPKGLCYVEVALVEGRSNIHAKEETPCVLMGKSPRGSFYHAVVGIVRDGEFRVHFDPHPDRKGIKSIDWIGFIVKRV